MGSQALKEHLERLAPKSAEAITQPDYSKEELSQEEIDAAIYRAKKEKAEKREQDRFNKEYWDKITAPPVAKYYSAEELRNKLLLSRTATGQRFIIDSDNMAQVNALCMYFSLDSRLSEYGFSHSKGLLLMGGLGIGKTHLMSFFFQNQKASYVMSPCRTIENKWVNAKPEEPDYIEYYSRPIQGAVNSNPYGHQQLGICLDDLGTETVPSKRFGEEKNVLAEIILARYEIWTNAPSHLMDNHITHITTNLTGAKLKEIYGDRISDRLKEMCNVITFDKDAKSRR
jgi:DNA replication protein DnaC